MGDAVAAVVVVVAVVRIISVEISAEWEFMLLYLVCVELDL